MRDDLQVKKKEQRQSPKTRKAKQKQRASGKIKSPKKNETNLVRD